jgi:AcrR family transcriptional regulator
MAEKGVEGATVLDVVRAAGVSQPSFYNHFRSRDELAEVIAADFFRADAEFKKRVLADVEDVAVAVAINCLHTLRIAIHDPVVAWVMINSAGASHLLVSGAGDELVHAIRRGISTGRFRDFDARTTALVIRGATLPVLRTIVQGESNPGTEQQFVTMVLQMLGLAPGAADAACAAASGRLLEWEGLAA